MNTGLKSGLRVMICLTAILIMCGDVEQNPGPKSESSNDRTSSGRPSSPLASANADSSRNVSINFAFEYCCACYLKLFVLTVHRLYSCSPTACTFSFKLKTLHR